MAVTLPARRWGRGTEPLVLLHGFTGTGAAFDHLEPLLEGSVRAVCLDLPGHGGSAIPEDADGWSAAVAAVASAIERAHEGPAHLAGYSLGARLALAVALRHPGIVRSVVLESGAAGLHAEAERRERRAQDDDLAAAIERDGVAAFVERWEQNEVLAGLRKLPADAAAALRARRLSQSARGLAWSLRNLGAGAQPDLWPELGKVPVPALLVYGSRDDKFRAHAERMALRIPDASLREIRGAGHAPHLEKPAAHAAALLEFIGSPRAHQRTAEPHGQRERAETKATPGSPP